MPKLLLDMGQAVLWALVSAVAMGLSMGLVIKIFDMLTPGIDEMEELRKGNIAVAIVLGAVILAFGIVMGLTLHAPATGGSAP